jgi:ArsR family transcriptional regulator
LEIPSGVFSWTTLAIFVKSLGHIDNLRCDAYNDYIDVLRCEVIRLENENTKHAKVFKAFCDENRLVILQMLCTGEKCACKLQDALVIGQSTLSHHMKILCEAGIVKARKEGKWTYYSIHREGRGMAIKLLTQLTEVTSDEPDCDCLE